MTDKEYRILIRELQDDPCQLGFASMDDETVAKTLNAKTFSRPVQRFCSLRTIATVLDDQEYAALKTVLRQAAAVSERVADMLRLLEMPCDWTGTTGGLDFGHEAVRAFIRQLPIGETVQQKLLRLGEEPCSRAEQLGLPPVYPGHVESARKLMEG